MKLLLPLFLVTLSAQVLASDMQLFNKARFTGEVFEGKTRTILGDDCTMSIDTNGDKAIVTVAKGDSFEKTYEFNLNGSYFYRGDYGLEFSDGKRASEANPALKIKFDPAAWDRDNELVPLEYKVLTDSGSTHTIFGGKEKKLYRCKM